ncbi:hypothetical protein U9M48_024904 [Paspalum notatum var. saurae]|uniref:Uncharacterized protein n=1 Tax=Paspalum notatum var. saurae TaxID=547442 RepID=A0AAQ3TPQ2_PASNO
MPWFPALAPPALAAAYGGGRIKKRARLPRLLHRLFIKVLRLRPSAAKEEDYGCYAYRMGGGAGDDEEYCYCYSYGGVGSSSWAGVLSSIPEEDFDVDDSSDSEEGTPDVVVAVPPGPAAVLRKAKSERFVVGPPVDAATVVHLEVLL